MKNDIVLIGGGGHCKSCIDVIEADEKFRIAGIVDKKINLHNKVLGYEIFAIDNDIAKLSQTYKYFFITFAFIKNPQRRIEVFNELKSLDVQLPVIISPLAHVSKYSEIGEGTIIMHHALINAGSRIGINCIINTKALIEHEVSIGDNCHIATAAVINGGVVIESETFIGSNSTCRENIRIAKKSIISFHSRVAE